MIHNQNVYKKKKKKRKKREEKIHNQNNKFQTTIIPTRTERVYTNKTLKNGKKLVRVYSTKQSIK